jgi:hypothetical protein
VVFISFASALSMAALFVDPDEPAAAILATAIFDVHRPFSALVFVPRDRPARGSQAYALASAGCGCAALALIFTRPAYQTLAQQALIAGHSCAAAIISLTACGSAPSCGVCAGGSSPHAAFHRPPAPAKGGPFAMWPQASGAKGGGVGAQSRTRLSG